MYISEWIYWPDPTKFRETIAASMAMGELWKKHGATDSRLSSLNGSDMGCLANTITFENAEAFGKASDATHTRIVSTLAVVWVSGVFNTTSVNVPPTSTASRMSICFFSNSGGP